MTPLHSIKPLEMAGSRNKITAHIFDTLSLYAIVVHCACIHNQSMAGHATKIVLNSGQCLAMFVHAMWLLKENR